MNRDIGGFVRLVVALALFGFVTMQTLGALRASGAWSKPGAPGTVAPDDPVASVERLLAARQAPLAPGARDPFLLGPAPTPLSAQARPVVRKPVVPPPPPRPVLTAIVWDADPRAIVHWNNRDWTIRSGGLFDEFVVASITRDQVVLTRGTETIVLQRKTQGD